MRDVDDNGYTNVPEDWTYVTLPHIYIITFSMFGGSGNQNNLQITRGMELTPDE
jgi:hypothetical protein